MRKERNLVLQKICSGTKLGTSIAVTPDLPFFVEVGLRPTIYHVSIRVRRASHTSQSSHRVRGGAYLTNSFRGGSALLCFGIDSARPVTT